MVFADLLHRIFANKLTNDDRIDDPLFTFDAPIPRVVGISASCSFLSPDFVFYGQLVVVRTMVKACLFIICLESSMIHITFNPSSCALIFCESYEYMCR